MSNYVSTAWARISRALWGSRGSGCETARSVDERVRMAKACALVATPEAIQFTN